jgi:hypothetical protein
MFTALVDFRFSMIFICFRKHIPGDERKTGYDPPPCPGKIPVYCLMIFPFLHTTGIGMFVTIYLKSHLHQSIRTASANI